jgi:geranylgeranyl diphosphate synthase type II
MDEWTIFYKKSIKLIEEYIASYFAKKSPQIYPTLWSAMKYTVLNKGKRLRPVLVLLGAKLSNKNCNPRTLLPTAVGIEFIHTYSLIHDDLPPLDNDDYRRGKLSCHKKFGEDVGILTGDALLTEGFSLIAREQKKYSSPKKVIEVMEILSSAIGPSGMITGQLMDLKINKYKDKENIDFIQMYKYKTANLIAASLACGATLASGNKKKIEEIKSIGESLGILFQLTDDLVDVEKDKLKHILTYPIVHGKEKTLSLINDVKERIISLVNKNKHFRIIIPLMDYIIARKK